MKFWTAAEDAQLKAYVEQGLSGRDIAARFPGSTRNAILGRVWRLGFGVQVRQVWTETLTARLLRLDIDGYTLPQIAAKLDMTVPAVGDKLRRVRGIKLRRSAKTVPRKA